jgi:7-keto-8-aminopelargonate synthetase-like enzyme
MAKINHNSFIDTVNDMLGQARRKEVMHLQFTDQKWSGNNMKLGEKNLVNFGTCGYLGLETHPKLIEGAMDFTSRFGTQFSISRAFVTSSQNRLLEEQLSCIFEGHHTIVFSSTTLAHVSVIPIVMGSEDAIILDQQAHLSMQTGTQLMAAKGLPIELIRHNNLNMLEDKIIALRDKHKKIWYVIDGVYSMYGDLAPFEELNELAKKYPQLHFYVDDAHGMSWYGQNGRGCAYDFFKENKRTILVTTMAKGFGSTGGIVVFPDHKLYDKILIYGGPLAFSHPIAPAIIGASMASAGIHLSAEITELQKSLEHKMNLCNSMLEQTDIPILSYPDTPIYFLGTGQPNVGFNLNKRILDEGYYVNLGIFPAVSIKNTGLRFTITNHVSDADIIGFVDALKYHYPKALEEEGKVVNQVRKAFKLKPLDSLELEKVTNESNLKLKIFNDINLVDKEKWNLVMSDKGGCTWENMKMTQEAYSGNTKPEENAEMYYYMVFDGNNELVCCTVFSLMLMKDDMFEPALKSIYVEQMRKEDTYFLTSKTFFMGSMLTEGDHLFIDYANDWKAALKLIFDHLNKELESTNSNNIILRDFEDQNQELSEFIYDQGFAKISMPNSNVITNLKDQSLNSFFESLSARNRRHARNDVFKYESLLNTVIAKNLSFEDQKKAYKLLLNVSRKNFAVNIFDYSLKLIQKMNESENWEFIKVILNNELVAVGFCHKIASNYYPVLVGIDYEFNTTHKVYKQMLYQVVKRAIELKCDKVYFGLSADIEKRKFKAHQIEKVAYIYSRDNFNFEQLYNIRENEKIPA